MKKLTNFNEFLKICVIAQLALVILTCKCDYYLPC